MAINRDEHGRAIRVACLRCEIEQMNADGMSCTCGCPFARYADTRQVDVLFRDDVADDDAFFD